MALVDTNGVYGAPRFYGATKKTGVKALIGTELVMDVECGGHAAAVHPTKSGGMAAALHKVTLLVGSGRGYKTSARRSRPGPRTTRVPGALLRAPTNEGDG